MYGTRRPITEFPRMPDDGFTLIELMVVITIVGILATIGIANFISFQAKAKTRAVSRINTASTKRRCCTGPTMTSAL